MKLGGAVQWARRNWISCVLMAAIVVALNWGPGGEATTEIEPVPEIEATAPALAEEERQAALREALDNAIYRNRVQERERVTAQSTIEVQLEALEESAEPYEYAARLSALGNLYQQKHGDFRTAAGYYELLIEDYPDWPGIAGAYHQLIACYTHLNEPRELRLLYHKMLEAFPEGVAEHTYARAALGQ